jgi:hypothetical protein
MNVGLFDKNKSETCSRYDTRHRRCRASAALGRTERMRIIQIRKSYVPVYQNVQVTLARQRL